MSKVQTSSQPPAVNAVQQDGKMGKMTGIYQGIYHLS
jgi:hypothetical protein